MDASLADLAARLGAARTIAADDVLALRRAVYGAGPVTRQEAEVLIALDAAADPRAPEWGEFLTDALLDLVVRQPDPPAYVDEAAAAWLTRAMTGAGRLRRDGALEALARILDEADEVPPSFAAFVLAKAKDAAIAGGAVTAADVALLRRVVFAGGGAGNIAVTRAEADALFDIDAACRSADNDPAWPDFFAKAVAASLTAASPYRPQRREDAQRDEAWLAGRPSAGDFIKDMAHKPDFAGAMHEILHPFADEAVEWSAAEAEIETAQAAVAPVTKDEAGWLQARIGANGAPSQAEQRLVAFLKGEALAAPAEPSAASSPSSPAAPTFGHRGQAPVAAVARRS